MESISRTQNGKEDIIQTIASYLRRCKATGSQIEKVEFKQQKEEKHLIEFITSQMRLSSRESLTNQQ